MGRGSEARAIAVRSGFLVQLGIFLVVTAALVLFTAVSGGDFWWLPIAAIWGLSVAGYGLWAAWLWRRETWEDETQRQRMRFFAPSNPFRD